ncbi:transporter [Gammaproteobacteria bacterium 54_18_T64]|nr:transporter [Gammaproteobacteria bacterium 54_18_T64]
MGKSPSNDPLHGVTLKEILNQLVDKYGWQELAQRITINCFSNDPSINSSLKFLRKTPWARKKVESLYIETDWNNKNIWSIERSGHDG